MTNSKPQWYDYENQKQLAHPHVRETVQVQNRGKWVDVFVVGLDSENCCVYEYLDAQQEDSVYDGVFLNNYMRPLDWNKNEGQIIKDIAEKHSVNYLMDGIRYQLALGAHTWANGECGHSARGGRICLDCLQQALALKTSEDAADDFVSVTKRTNVLVERLRDEADMD
jgi:hypothetical protein